MVKSARTLAMLAALAGAGAWFQPNVSGGDLWWHLAEGREIVAKHAPQTIDHYSFTFAGQPLQTPEWLWGAGYWLVYRVSPDAVALVNLAFLFVIFGVWYMVARRHSGSPMGSAVALWAAAATCYWFLDIRPHEVTLLAVGLILLTRDRWWARWMWAPLFIDWCNLHGGFVFGLGVIGLFALVQTTEASIEEGRVRIDPTLWLGVALAAAALVVNPWGWRILEFPLSYLDRQSPFLGLVEWLPTPFDLDPRTFSGRFVWLFGVASLGAVVEIVARARGGRNRGDVFLVLLAAVTSAMAFESRRFIPLFALTSLPLTARLCQTVIVTASRRIPERQSGRAAVIGAVLALAVAGFLWRDVRILPRPLDRWTESHTFPKAALRYAVALDAGPRVVNQYTWGGYISLHAPQFKILIDGRANTVYSAAAYNDYNLMMSSPGGFHARLITYAPDFVLIQSGPLATALAKPPFSWVLAYSDQIASILLPPNSPRRRRPLPVADEVVGDEPQWLVAKAAELASNGETAAARRFAEEALARNPLALDGYRVLADCSARELDTAGIYAVLARGLAANPRMAEGLYQAAAHALYETGAKRRALDLLTRAVPRGPFSSRGPVLLDIAHLRAELDPR